MEENKVNGNKKKKLAAIIGISLLTVGAIVFLLLGRSNSLRIYFDAKGGTSVNTQIVDKNGKLTKPSDPEREGYIFDGWYEGSKAFNFENLIKRVMTLVAKWKPVESVDETKYTVTFNTDGGSTIKSIKVEKDKFLSTPTTPIKEGYNFVSWQLGGKDFDFKSKITKNITLKAIWEKIPVIEPTPIVRYRVTFNSDGGSAVTSKTVDKGKAITRPTNPTRSGYTFMGWYLNNNIFNFNNGIFGNITLVAKWEQVVVIETYSIESAFFQNGSPQVIVFVKKNGTTIGASSVLTNDEKVVGTFDTEFNVILVDQSDYSKISKARLSNGTIVNVK